MESLTLIGAGLIVIGGGLGLGIKKTFSATVGCRNVFN